MEALITFASLSRQINQMIRLFRKIRHKLLAEQSYGVYILYASGEIMCTPPTRCNWIESSPFSGGKVPSPTIMKLCLNQVLINHIQWIKNAAMFNKNENGYLTVEINRLISHIDQALNS